MHDGRFSKSCHFSNIWGFFKPFFAQNNSNTIKERFFACFFLILIFDPNWSFFKGYSLCMMADFQNRLISRLFGVFSSGFFAQNNSNMIKESVFACFFLILIFDPNWPFCKGYRLSFMADFQNRLICRIFGVFWSGFLQRTTLTWLKNRFSRVFLILIFDPNWPFCKGYSLCLMADFQNRLISQLFGVFSSGFLHTTTLTWLKNRFPHVFLNFNFWPKLTVLQRL